MARQVRRISDLPEAGPLEGDELLEMIQGGENVRIRADELGGGGDIAIDDVTGLTEALDDRVLDTDPRLSDSRAPKGGAGGVLSGQYPNPGFAVPMATAAQLAEKVGSIVAGSGITVDDSDPVNPIVSATGGGGGGGVESIVAGDGISVDDSDPANPVVSATVSAGTEVNVQTGTAYTLVLTDAFQLVAMDNAGTNTLTVPPNSAVAFPTNTRIDLGQDGAGQTTIVAAAGVTIRTPETLRLRKQWSKASLIRRAENVWDIVGDLEAAT